MRANGELCWAGTIDKCGGLDEYLLSTKPARLSTLGPFGWNLRWQVINTPAVKERFEEERVKLGLAKAKPRTQKEFKKAEEKQVAMGFADLIANVSAMKEVSVAEEATGEEKI